MRGVIVSVASGLGIHSGKALHCTDGQNRPKWGEKNHTAFPMDNLAVLLGFIGQGIDLLVQK